ncbi:MAG: glucuronate isomerase [Candidatus Izemoplasmataceae bacterium]
MFITDDFCLQSDLAITLYESIKDAPIIDYHNHLSAEEIYKNRPYENITDIWLKHDHYKWRLMRASGIDEEYITGNASKKDKFLMYAKALENAYMNPLYHWSHMELKEYFGIIETLTSKNAKDIYEKINHYLETHEIGPRELLQQCNVETLCTTDDLNDNLSFHRQLGNEKHFDMKVLPTFRPDSLFHFNNQLFFNVISALETNTSIVIKDIDSLKTALSLRLDFFEQHHTFIADHGLTTLNYVSVSDEEASVIFQKRLEKHLLSSEDTNKLTVYLLTFFITEYASRGLVCQLHIGALRNTNEKMYKRIGSDTGYDSLSDNNYINDLNALFSEIEIQHTLPKMILYNLHPKDNETLASLCGNFTSVSPGKIQLGPAWWFNDNIRGIIKQIEAYSEYLNLDTMIGMTTDSRSFLSFVRHDYYRRILTNYIANQVLLGHIPNDKEKLERLISHISYYNSKTYFNL